MCIGLGDTSCSHPLVVGRPTGASQGIGRGIALKLGSVGCNVLIISRSGEAAERVVREIAAAGGTASAAIIDVGNPDQALRMAEVAIERYGTIDILCANAGIFPASKLDTKMQASIPMGRLGTVGDIANAVLFFASDEAAYITGQTLVIDGGQVLPESLMALEEMNAA